MQNKGLIVALIILLSIVVFLLVMFLVLVLNGNLSFSNGVMGLGKKNDTIIFDKTYEFEGIDNIEVLSKAGDVNFKEGSEDNVRVVIYGKTDTDVNVELNNNKLEIDYSKYKPKIFGFNNDVNDIIVYIPISYMGKIDVKNEYGVCKVCDLENATVIIDSDCGNVEMGKTKDIDISCDMGNVEVNSILNKCQIKANCGSIKINNLLIKENSHIECDLGDVKINNASDVFIDAKVDLGDIKIKDNNRYADVTLDVEVDCGDVKVGI